MESIIKPFCAWLDTKLVLPVPTESILGRLHARIRFLEEVM